jgi:hypothetical protein
MIQIRNFTVETVTRHPEEETTQEWGERLGAWAEVIERDITASVDDAMSITVAEFDLAEEVIGLIRFKDGHFEVGVAETLRPYIKVLDGDNEGYALLRFWSRVQNHATCVDNEEGITE